MNLKIRRGIKQSVNNCYGNQGSFKWLSTKAADLHRQWLSYTWADYSKEAHAGLADMYVADERFKAYYDKIKVGAAEFLRDAIKIYTKTSSC